MVLVYCTTFCYERYFHGCVSQSVKSCYERYDRSSRSASKRYQNCSRQFSLWALGQRHCQAGGFPVDPSSFLGMLWIFRDKQTLLNTHQASQKTTNNHPMRQTYFLFLLNYRYRGRRTCRTCSSDPVGTCTAGTEKLGLC